MATNAKGADNPIDNLVPTDSKLELKSLTLIEPNIELKDFLRLSKPLLRTDVF